MNDEIKKAAKEWSCKHSNKGCPYDCNDCWQITLGFGCEQHNMELAFMEGARWMLENPSGGSLVAFTNKVSTITKRCVMHNVCEWLSKNTILAKTTIERLKKHMEDEL